MTLPRRIRVSPLIPGKDLTRDMDKILLRLGEVANAWAGMEELLCLVFCHLAGTDYDTSTVIFYTPSSFRGRLEIIRSLVRHKVPDCREKGMLNSVIEKLNGLNTTRNALVHARYGMLMGQRSDGRPYGWVKRENVHPSKVDLKISVKGQIGEMDNHLEALGNIYQFLHFFCQRENGSPCPIRAWAKIALIRPGITSS